MSVHLLLVGTSHRTAPVDLRERLDFHSRGLDLALRSLADRRIVSEAVVISTCNRAEIYAACEAPEAAIHAIVAFISEFHDVAAEAVRPHVYAHLDQSAARHLFRVSSGLDSLVVGEPQILGQVKEAFGVAAAQQSAGPLLHKLFHWAFGVGKRVRSETALAEGAVSVSYAAVNLAKKIFGSLDGRRVLVAGTGEMGRLTAVHLQGQGAASIVVTSRTLERADELAREVRGQVVPWDALLGAVADADIVITATGAASHILSKDQVRSATRARRARPLFLIDIAVPRDVDPSAGDIEEVFLYNIDDLQAIVRENLERRGTEIGQAEQIIDEEVQRFASWRLSRAAVPTIVALRQRFEEIRRAELARLEPRLAALPPDARAKVDEVTRLIVEKLLLTPTEQLKQAGDAHLSSQYSEVVARLFGLHPEPSSAADRPTKDRSPR